MAVTKRQPAKRIRRSVSLSADVDRQVHAIAKHRRMSDSRLLAELVERGIHSARREQEFFDTAARFRAATDDEEIRDLGDRLGRSIFGE